MRAMTSDSPQRHMATCFDRHLPVRERGARAIEQTDVCAHGAAALIGRAQCGGIKRRRRSAYSPSTHSNSRRSDIDTSDHRQKRRIRKENATSQHVAKTWNQFISSMNSAKQPQMQPAQRELCQLQFDAVFVS